MLRRRKLPLKIIKNNIKLKLKNCEIHEDLLYINDKFYISDNSKLRIEIIRLVYDILFNKYIKRLFIYDRFSRYYY